MSRVTSKYHCQRGKGGCGFKFTARKSIEKLDDVHCPACGANKHTRRRTHEGGVKGWDPAIVRIPAEVPKEEAPQLAYEIGGEHD